MAKRWYDPRTWLEKGEVGDFIWAEAAPFAPHAGLAGFAQGERPSYALAFKVFGVPEDGALQAIRREFTGKVVDWQALTPSEKALLDKHKQLGLSTARLRAILKK